jgi:acyl-CoA dehydrogenase
MHSRATFSNLVRDGRSKRMDVLLDDVALAWRNCAAEFASKELIPWEVEAELHEGKLAPEVHARHKQRAVELGFSALDVPSAHGGRDTRVIDQVAVWEQLGRVTNALSWCFSEPQRWMFEACTPEQLARYVLPLMKGKRKECYAITESGSGSEVDIQTTARRVAGGYAISGEKWYVTSANHADFFILQARLTDGPHAGSDCMFFRFDDVVVPESQRLGPEGDGMRHSHTWFRRERLMIAARCCGAATRLLEEARAFAATRMIGGEPLAEKQMVQAMFADSVTELWAARLITYEAAHAHDRGDEMKSLHARCSIAKLYASEAANRIADRVLQIFGGRGYMRENAAERFFRELRVDRIWEGASEVQRLIIARAFLKRGIEGM